DYGLGDLGEIDARVLLGAKVMRQITDEDAFVTSARLTWRRAVGALPGSGLGVWIRGDFGDRSERASERDYMRGGGAGGVRARIGPVTLSVGGGYRAFVYKPDLDSNHQGPSAEAAVSVDIYAALSAALSYVY